MVALINIDRFVVKFCKLGEDFNGACFDAWQGFDVGSHDDFGSEVRATAENKDLMTFLANRRSYGKRVPLADVKEMLDL